MLKKISPRHCLVALLLLLGNNTSLLAQHCVLPTTAATDYDFNIARDTFGPNPDAPTDYYKLAVNWSGDYCAKINTAISAETDPQKARQLRRENQFHCFSDNQFGWVVHGLWASSCAGKSLAQCTDLTDIKKHPRFCRGDLPPLAYAEIEPYLCISPGAALLQAEWEKHGACDFVSAHDYFAQEKNLFEALQFPERNMSHKELDNWLKQHNPALQNKQLLFRESEIYICYNTQFEFIDCPQRD
jgi:ribonuclease T2